MNGIIGRISIYPAKGEPGKNLREARLIEGRGLEGDFHADGEKQVSLLPAETREALAAWKESGLCFSRFKENLTVRGIAPNELRPGTRLAAGDAIMEIAAGVKRCHAECPLHAAGKRCPLAGKSLFAKVLKSGIIRVGDTVKGINIAGQSPAPAACGGFRSRFFGV